MIFITGDTHRKFDRVFKFCEQANTSTDDILIILGDSGINYYGNSKGDLYLKKKLSKLPITFYILQGNHDRRPETIPTYLPTITPHGVFWKEPEFKNLFFFRNGDIYNIDKLSFWVMGGAYSVDKFYRLENGMHWFPDEQPAANEIYKGRRNLDQNNWEIDIVLTHTCPFSLQPTESFLPMIDQSTVDKTTEHMLENIYKDLTFNWWLCGHFHIDKIVGNVRFVYEDIIAL